MKRAACTLFILAAAAVMTAGAARAEDPRGENPVPQSSLAGRRYFMVTEAGVRKTWMPVSDPLDQYIFVNSIGVMKNISHARAVGGSLDATVALGQLKFAPAVRYKQWLRGAGSVDASLGYIAGNSRGAVGPVVSAR